MAIVIGGIYDIDRPGMPILRGRVITDELDAPTLPHLWMHIFQYPPERNPVLVPIGPGILLVPVPA